MAHNCEHITIFCFLETLFLILPEKLFEGIPASQTKAIEDPFLSFLIMFSVLIEELNSLKLIKLLFILR